MSRKPLLAGNWKMFKNSREARDFISELRGLISPFKSDREVALAVPFTSLEASAEAAAGSPIIIAAQNLYWENEGAFTGEISGPMIKAAGASAVLIGHSERRQFFGDTGRWVNQKLGAALKAGLLPVVCLGESLNEREGGQTFDVLARQLNEALEGFTSADLGPLVIAYEPVWAIGTGLTATPDQAQEVHAFLRGRIEERYEKSWADSLRILYGGSVKPENAADLMAQPDIDGALVGGASLKPASFAAIVNYDR